MSGGRGEGPGAEARRPFVRASLVALALCVAALSVFAPACRDGNEGETAARPRGLTPSTRSVTSPVSVLSHPQTIIGPSTAAASASLNNPTCILPIVHESSFDIGQKPSEFVEGAIFVGTEQPDPVTGTVRLVHASAATSASNGLYWPPATASPILPVRGLAIDILEYPPLGRLNGYTDAEGLLKGRLWVATGRFDPGLGVGVSRLHVLAGRGDVASRAAVELAQITPTAIDAAGGEFLTALVAAPPGLILFAASQTRILRITVAASEVASTIEVFADLPRASGDQAISALACDETGRLYALQRGASGFTLTAFERAPLATVPATGTAFTLSYPQGGPVLASPTAISTNSADHLVVAERASGLFFEFDRTGALTATLSARSAPAQLPNPPASTGSAPAATTLTGANQIAAFACDPYLSRIVFATDAQQTGGGGGASGNPAVRTLANVTFRGGVLPILENRCVFCHSSATGIGGLDLTGEASLRHARLLGRACQTFAPDDPARPTECDLLPVQNPFFLVGVTTSPTVISSVFAVPGATCPSCPFPLPLGRVTPGAPTASYVILKLLTTYPGALLYFPADLSLPSFTNNCAATAEGALDPGEVCGERCPQGSFVQRPLRRAEIDMLEEWIRRGALDD